METRLFMDLLPSTNGKIIAAFEEDKEAMVLNCSGEYLNLCINSICGYMHKVWIKPNIELSKFIENKM